MRSRRVSSSSSTLRSSADHYRSECTFIASIVAIFLLGAPQAARGQCYNFQGTTSSGGAASLAVSITNLPVPTINSVPGFIAYAYNLAGGNTASLTLDGAVYSTSALFRFEIVTTDQTSQSISGFELALEGAFRAYVELQNGAGDFFPNGLPAVLPAPSQFATPSFLVYPPLGSGQNAQTVTLTSISSGCALPTGNLVQISVAADGTAWGVNSEGAIYQWISGSQTWQNIPGVLSQIAVGASGSVWGVNPANEIYRFDQSTQSWVQVPGYLSQIAVGADGDTWGINSAQQIYHYDSAGQIWEQIPGYLTQIAVGFSGAVWGLNSAGNIYRFDTGTGYFEQIPGVLQQIAVGVDGDVWGVNPADEIYHFDTLSQAWAQVPGSLSEISVISEANVWGVNAAGGAYAFNAGTQTWGQFPGEWKHVTAGPTATAWGFDNANNVYQLVAPF